jgi:putative transposase
MVGRDSADFSIVTNKLFSIPEPVKQVLTVVCKLEVTPEQVPNVQALFHAFASACNYVQKEVPEQMTNEVRMQSLVYRSVRALFGLSSQLAIHAIHRVASDRKTAKQKGKPVKQFRPTSVTYDVRTFSFRESDWAGSLTTLGKRQRFRLHIGKYQRKLLLGQKPKTATLVVNVKGEYHLHIQLESQIVAPSETENVLGVDLGRTDIAVTSDGDSFSGEGITKVRNHYARLPASLQKKATRGTRSSRRRCRRLLQRLSGRERRFQQHTNHVVSKCIVQHAKTNNQVIALEDLTGIREPTNQQPRSQQERRLSNSWAFYQLRQFLTYKAIKHGVKLILVNPAYTSQTCHRCLHIHPEAGKSYRQGKQFCCGHCGLVGDADLNGARNIAILGRSINTPGGSGLACCLSEQVSGLLKTPSAYAVG